MMYRKSLIGLRFNQWIVVAATGTRYWHCKCDCGVERKVCDSSLKSGLSVSCGHDRPHQVSERVRTHGLSKTIEYKIWGGMVNRCHNPKNSSYPRYGARGVSVCEQWRRFENFLADMGPRPSPLYSIDRYPNNDGNYEPGNCRWATAKEQVRNRRPFVQANARKTHCPKGHEYSGHNLIVYSRLGHRHCRACKIEAARRYHMRKRAAAMIESFAA